MLGKLQKCEAASGCRCKPVRLPYSSHVVYDSERTISTVRLLDSRVQSHTNTAGLQILYPWREVLFCEAGKVFRPQLQDET